MSKARESNPMDPTNSWLHESPKYYCTLPVSATITAFVLENAAKDDDESLPKHLRTYLPGDANWFGRHLHMLPKPALESKGLLVFTVGGAERLSAHHHLGKLAWVCRTSDTDSLDPRTVRAPPRPGIRWLCCGRA